MARFAVKIDGRERIVELGDSDGDGDGGNDGHRAKPRVDGIEVDVEVLEAERGVWILRGEAGQTVAAVDGSRRPSSPSRSGGRAPTRWCWRRRWPTRAARRSRRPARAGERRRAGHRALADPGAGGQAAGEGRRCGEGRPDRGRPRGDEDGERAARAARRPRRRRALRGGSRGRSRAGPRHDRVDGAALDAGGVSRGRGRGSPLRGSRYDAQSRARAPMLDGGPRPLPRRAPRPEPAPPRRGAPDRSPSPRRRHPRRTVRRRRLLRLGDDGSGSGGTDRRPGQRHLRRRQLPAPLLALLGAGFELGAAFDFFFDRFQAT